MCVAIIGDRYSADQFHRETWPSIVRCAGVEDAGDVGMIHHRQRLTLRFKSCNDRAAVGPQFDNLQRNFATDRLELAGAVDDAPAAFPEPLNDAVASADCAGLFDGSIIL